MEVDGNLDNESVYESDFSSIMVSNRNLKMNNIKTKTNANANANVNIRR